MNANKSISYHPLSHNEKPYQIKEHISLLATKIKVRMDENQILKDTIDNLSINIHRSKQQLKKFSLFQNKSNIENEINKNISNLKTLNKNLNVQRRLLLQKYIKLKNKYSKELEPLKTELNLLSDRKFIMENVMNKKDYEIQKYTSQNNENLNLYLREEMREFTTNNLDMDEDVIIADLEKSQAILLNKLKDFNKTYNKCNEYKKNIKILKNIIKKVKNKNINDLTEDEIKILFNIKNNNITNISNNQYIDELNSIEEDSILNDTINSEYDDDDNIEFTPISKNYYPLKLGGKFEIPKINLEQIEYNKRKLKQEDAEKSLSREMKDYDEYDLKIKELKNKIRKAKIKNRKYQEKCYDFDKKIKMMEQIIINMKKYNFDLTLSSNRNENSYNNKHFSSRGIGNSGGRKQITATISVKGRGSTFGDKYVDKSNKAVNNDNSF